MAASGWGPQNPGNGNPYGPYPPPPPPRPVPVRRRSIWRWGLVSMFIPVIRSSRRRAEALFNQPGGGRVDDPVVFRVQAWRAALGAATSLLLIYAYGTDGGWSGAVDNGFEKIVMAPLLLIVTGPLVILGLIQAAPAAHRGLLRSRLRAPVKAVAWYIGVLVICGVVLVGGTTAMEEVPSPANGLIAMGLLAALVWLVPFFLFASVNAARYAFNTAHVHAALPALLTVALVWELTLFSMALDGLPHGPPAAQLAMAFGGPITVTAVALWELRRLRTRHGVRVRG
ncbi:hypothetical protein [Streptomyces sp. H27-D2]|uniref:hypothetical protein n=1 Tax=Streptomyces sp. H27-D2 TaxID=3046304 RepID=UPI002DBAD33F|nr:hypothetical protein [Streptomyces sp. H27-D2]MEC4016552.1 hypothetical protein [Streptomyces sp. H27-D2]